MIPTEISNVRNRLGLSQSQLAELLGVHPLTVSKWERGVLRPSAHHEALLDSFEKARRANKAIGEEVRSALVAAGVVLALYLLLSAAVGEK